MVRASKPSKPTRRSLPSRTPLASGAPGQLPAAAPVLPAVPVSASYSLVLPAAPASAASTLATPLPSLMPWLSYVAVPVSSAGVTIPVPGASVLLAAPIRSSTLTTTTVTLAASVPPPGVVPSPVALTTTTTSVCFRPTPSPVVSLPGVPTTPARPSQTTQMPGPSAPALETPDADPACTDDNDPEGEEMEDQSISTPPTSTESDEEDDFQIVKRKKNRPNARQRQRRREALQNSAEPKLEPTGGSGPQPGSSTATAPHTKDGRVPPVVLRDKSRWSALRLRMTESSINYSRSVNANIGIRIHPATIDDYRKLIALMESDESLLWHSYSLPDGRPLRVVIRGVAEFITEEEVLQDLQRQGFRPLACKRMTKGPERRELPLFYVKLRLDDDARKIYSLRYICGLCVTVEAKKPNTEQHTQCHRCQLYGHGQRLCRAEVRCVRCAGPHWSYQCTNKEQLPTCALCSGPHQSNSKDCPKIPSKKTDAAPANPETTKKMEKKKKPAASTETTPMDTSEPVPSCSTYPTTYAAMTAKTTTKGSPPTAPTLSEQIPIKSQESKTPVDPLPVTAEGTADYSTPKAPPRPNVNLSDFSSLLAMSMQIDWRKLLEIVLKLLPKLLQCGSLAEVGTVLLSNVGDLLSVLPNQG